MPKTQPPQESSQGQEAIELIARDLDVMDFPGHLFRVLDTRATEYYVAISPRPDVTPRQVAVLLALNRAGAASQAQLAGLVRTDRNTLAEIIGRMVERKLILRKPSLQDKRSSTLELSKQGQELLWLVLPAMVRAQQTLLAPLPAEYHRIFMQCLRQLSEAPFPPDLPNDSAGVP